MDAWPKMDGVPERVGTCAKLRQGQLMMQRYQWIWNTYQHDKRYGDKAKLCKEKSLVLAKKMVEHARGCATCQREKVLTSDVFYGVVKNG